MKRRKLLDAMSLADEKYVNEAVPAEARPRARRYKLMALVACLCCILVAGGLFLFMPFNDDLPEIDQYENSEYYEIIKKLQPLTVVKNEHDNWFELLFSGMFKNKAEDMSGGLNDSMNIGSDAPTDDGVLSGNGSIMDGGSGDNKEESYEEITDNQVSGVIEADRIKRSDKHIYYLYGTTIRVYSIAGADSNKVGEYNFHNYADGSKTVSYYNDREIEFYLSQDCKTITVVAPFYGGGAYVRVISLDVSDPTNITEKKSVTVSGNYLSSRVKDGKVLLLARFSVAKNPNFSNFSEFVPEVITADGVSYVPAKDIYSPDKLTTARYTVVVKLSEGELNVEGKSAFLSYAEEEYVSADNVYVTRSYSSDTENGDIRIRKTCTEISCIYYVGESFEHKGTVTVDGYIKDQYSLDEKDGILRVVVTTDTYSYSYRQSEDVSSSDVLKNGTNANLYCIKIDTWETVAQVIAFAPWNETVQSVRFDGDRAYVCTAVVVELTDPVYFFDLSDLNNITYADTGAIDGYSTSLVNFAEGKLMGIGVGEIRDSLKIEIYERVGDGVGSVCAYELSNTLYSENYKSYYINREKRLIGLGVEIWNENAYGGKGDYESRYILLHFDGYELRDLVNVELAGYNDYKRAVYIDGYFYMFGDNCFEVFRIEID